VKIIGKSGDHGLEFIALVGSSELQKVFDKYYNDKGWQEPKVGDVIDLSAGHDFRNEIRGACESMASAMKKFSSAQQTLLRFAQMVNELPPPEELAK
jgi:hypothetical protein